jgi:uncharacterized protein YceH (UPF0502 family)
VLTPIEARVLGCLIEKQATTPDAYPLTLKALTTACNQSSSRDPVMSVTEHTVETTVLALKALGYARVVYPGSGERATKYRHVADEVLGLDDAKRALLGLLFLRGPQTAAELRMRAERMHPFATTGEVEDVLRAMEGHEPPLVQRYERIGSEREGRWGQVVAEEAVPLEARAASSGNGPAGGPGRADRLAELEARVAALEAKMAELQALLH